MSIPSSPVGAAAGPYSMHGSLGGPSMSSRYPSMSPPHSPASTLSGGVGCLTHARLTAGAKLSRYLRRLVHVSHMDFELASWQMLYLLARPQQVYRNFMYRKRTKDQYARDDPAFLVLLSAALVLTSLLHTVVLGLTALHYIKFLAWVVLVDCLGMGAVIATLLWLLANSYLRRQRHPDLIVEWAYCFDVHLNAFFPMLCLLHVVMPLMYLPIISYEGFFARLVGNSIWLAAVCYYNYITFLGYAAIKHLHNTHIFLYPFTFVFIFFVATVAFGWNISQSAMDFYKYRVI